LFTSEQQRKREAAYDAALTSVERDLQSVTQNRGNGIGIRERLVTAFGVFAAKALDLEPDSIHLLTHDFLPIGTGLAQWARRFDPDLSTAGVIQACRNAWTACGLQPLLGGRVALTPAILGYSLLYPYSDNYLDEQNVSLENKLRFSRRFRQRLQGEAILPVNHRERALWSLIELIEGQFERNQFPQVYSCLLAIHLAQEHSVRQQRSRAIIAESETLRLSCEKGGSSVLADASLAHGWLTEQESRFAFEWGVLLQLGDDLQDVREDLCRGSMTLFSRAVAAGTSLDSRTVQLLRFAEHVGEQMDRLPHGTVELKKFLKTSWRSLIIRAVADSHDFFSPAFVGEAQKRSPFRFEFLRSRQERLSSQQGLYAMTFESFIDCADDLQGLPSPHHRKDRAFEVYVDPAAVVGVLE
jgi:hypothetical protein